MKAFYWDAGVFLAYFNQEVGRADAVESILKYAHKNKCRIVTSSFTLVEVVHIKGQPALTADKEKNLDEFFRSPFINLIDATRNVCDEARQLIWKHGLRPQDATRLASALFGMKKRPDEINSYDNDFLKLSGLLGVPPISIRKPNDIPGSLFSDENTTKEKE